MLFAEATLVLTETQPDEAAVALLRQLLRPGGRVRLLALVRQGGDEGSRHWEALSERLSRAEARLAAAAEALGDAVPERDVVYELRASSLLGELLVLAEPRPEHLIAAALRAKRAVAWPGGRPVERLRELALPWWRDPRGALAAAALLRTRLPPDLHTIFLALDPQGLPPDAEAVRQLLGWPSPLEVEVIEASREQLRAALARFSGQRGVDMVALSAPTGAALMPFLWLVRSLSPDTALLLVPGSHTPAGLEPRLELTDLLLLDGRLLGSAVWVDATGRARPVEREDLSLVHRGEAVARVEVRGGQLDCPAPADLPELVGVARADGAAIEGLHGAVRVLRPGGGRVAIVDAGLDPEAWAAHQSGARRWWAVLLDPRAGAGAARARLPSADGLLDCSAVLQDGHPDDLPPGVASIRLERVVRHLRARGVPVELAVGAGPGAGYAGLDPATLSALTPEALEEHIARSWAPPRTDDRLLELTGAARSGAETLDIELDNAAARRRLLALLDGAERSVSLQTYIFEDDAVGRLVADRLCAAARRGVAVRVLVDSLYSLHGSLGRSNPPLTRLEASPGVSLRVLRPVAALEDLKRRNHRKLLIVDDRVGRISGRNIGAPYYTGFDEVALSPQTPYREVPWMDAGAEVTGPVVAELSRCFREAWRGAGGAPYPPAEPRGEARIPARLVTHDSMADARTLDAQRWLLEQARQQVTVVNTFPLQLELQRVLLDLLSRGIAVRFLVGNVRPTFNDRRPFPGGQLRELATQVIHGRLDALVEAGAAVYELGLEPAAGWSPELERVLPHVHAKVVSVDGRAFAIGSANLDITAGYWESEALLVVEHAPRAAALEDQLDALLERSLRVDPEDPAWRIRAERRAWLSRNWPSTLT